KPDSALLIVIRILQKDDVRLGPALADARDVDGRLILDWTHLLAGTAADAEAWINVRALQLHRQHRGLLAFGPRLLVAYGRFDFFDPDRLRRRGAELLADDAGRLHTPWKTPAMIVESSADLHRCHALTKLLFLGDLLDGACWANLAAEHARM